MRIADYAAREITSLGSKSAAKKALRRGDISINGKTASTADWVYQGDLIEFIDTSIRPIKKLKLPLDIVFEDEHLIVVNKPGGIAVNGNRYKTLENALADINKNSTLPDALPRPIAVHRLDVPTTGLVILAKTKSAQVDLNRLFQLQQVSKTYVAIVHGKPPSSGFIDTPIDEKKSSTKYSVVRSVPSRIFGHLSLVQLKPITGRTHQLRIHLKSIGHLIVGDKLYSENQKTILGKGVLLAAVALSFIHPITLKQLNLTIEPPAKFKRILDREETRYLS